VGEAVDNSMSKLCRGFFPRVNLKRDGYGKWSFASGATASIELAHDIGGSV
jgi:hypothetical protein